jgi:hypothetical protein
LFTLVLPNDLTSDHEAEGEGPPLLPCEQPCYAYGCGLDRTTGLVYPLEPAWRITLRPAVVAVAVDPNSFRLTDARDCRAHHDRQYDAAVYGDGLTAESLRRGEFAVYAAQRGEEDQMLVLFYSLVGRQPATRLRAVRNWRMEVQTIARGVVNQSWLVADRWGIADRLGQWAAVIRPQSRPADPSWADYEAWIASLQPAVADRDTPAAGIATWMDQSWRQVVQIAVAWLNHAAKTLDLVADQLSGWGQPEGSDRLGRRAAVQPAR